MAVDKIVLVALSQQLASSAELLFR
jgi:hypothetical protein